MSSVANDSAASNGKAINRTLALIAICLLLSANCLLPSVLFSSTFPTSAAS
jgi:hypothetical protein